MQRDRQLHLGTLQCCLNCGNLIKDIKTMKIVSSSRCVFLVTTVAAALVLAGSASAAVVEGFESLTLSSSNSIGDVSVQTPSYFGILPTEGTHELLLTTISTAGAHDTVAPQSGNNAVSVSNVATFL